MNDQVTTSEAPVENSAPVQQEAAPQAESNPRDEFLRSLPEEYQTDPSFANFNTLGDLAKSYKNASSMIGADKSQLVKIPKDGDMSEVYNMLGRPESADKYQVEALNDEKFLSFVDKEKIDQFSAIAHEKGVSNEALNSMLEFYRNDINSSIESQQKQFQEALEVNKEAARKELGGAYEERIGQIDSLYNTYADEGFDKLLDSNPHVFTDPAFIRFLGKIAPQFTEDGAFSGRRSSAQSNMTPAEASMEIAKFESNRENYNILRDKMHPRHNELKEYRSKLYRFKNS